MKEFLSNLFTVSNERLKNPLLFSFLLSWIAFNWRPITILFFSEKGIEERVIYITSNYIDIQFTLYFPLIFSIGYVLVLPYFTWIIEFLAKFPKNKRKHSLIKDQLSDWKDKQKVAREEFKYEQERAGNANISQLNSKIEELSESVNKKDKLIERLKIDLLEVKKEKKELVIYNNLESTDDADYSHEKQKELDNEYQEFIKTEASKYFEEVGSEISQFKSIPSKIDSIII